MGSATGLSWAAVLFSYLGRNDIWEVLRAGATPDELPNVAAEMLCPSDMKKGDARFGLSYVANCGWYDVANNGSATTDLPLQALFTDRAVTAPTPVRTDKIKDGAGNTLMLSENLQATQWFPLDALNGTTGRAARFQDAGMLWARDFGGTTSPDYSPYMVNLEKEATPTFPNTSAQADAYVPYVRPSSNHPGGVVVTYCDGHQDFLSDQIDEAVYRELMSPDDAQAQNTSFHTPELMP